MFYPLTMSSLQHLGCCYGKLPPMACLHTLGSICLRSMTSWRKVTAWNSPRDAHPKSMNSWEHVSNSYLTCLLLIHQVVALQWKDMKRGWQHMFEKVVHLSFVDFYRIFVMSQFTAFPFRYCLQIRHPVTRRSTFFVTCLFSISPPGWQWSPLDRPSFAEIHQAFETMFHDSSISEGTVASSLSSIVCLL